MNTTTALSDRLRSLFETGPRGIVGLVDELLTFAREQPLKCEWRKDACCVQGLGNGSHETVDVSIPKSAFRAVLARVAALCNEQTSDAVTPYGGESVLWNDAGAVRVAFTNSSDEQRLELSPEN